jgi:hypothetical protein
VYPEVARANLLRLRGDFEEAEKVCLAILKRFPNNPAAHGMMGDLSFETGKLDTARQWYEMALDLTPNDEGLRRKISAIENAARKEADDVAIAGLEVQPKSNSTIAAMLGVVILLCVMAGLMYWLGYANKTTRADVIDPISVNGEAGPRLGTRIQEPALEETPATSPAPSTERTALTAEEAAVLSAMSQELGALGSRVAGLILDSTGAFATVIGFEQDQVDAALVAQWLIRRGFTQASVRVLDPNQRTVRFSGTVTKTSLDGAQGEPGSNAWAASLFGTG